MILISLCLQARWYLKKDLINEHANVLAGVCLYAAALSGGARIKQTGRRK